MVNFIVKDLFGLIKVLREEGLTIAGPSMKSMENLVRFSTRKGIKLNCGNRQNDEKKFGKKFHTLIFALPIKKGV